MKLICLCLHFSRGTLFLPRFFPSAHKLTENGYPSHNPRWRHLNQEWFCSCFASQAHSILFFASLQHVKQHSLTCYTSHFVCFSCSSSLPYRPLMLQCHISHTVQSTWCGHYILMCSGAQQVCASSKTTQTSIRVLFYLRRFLTIISQEEHTMKTAYSAEEGFQTKWICNSLHQKLSTELRQNGGFFCF